MLPKPSIIKIPDASFSEHIGLTACSTPNFQPSGCIAGKFTCGAHKCQPYQGSCYDADFYGFGYALGVGATIGIAIVVS